MNILFILTNYPGFGGIEKVTKYLVLFLKNKGYKVSILSFGTNASSLLSDLSIQVDYVPLKTIYQSRDNEEFINFYLKRNDFDFVVFQDSYAPIEHIFRNIEYPWSEKLIVVEHNSPMSAFYPIIKNKNFYNGFLSFFMSNLSYFTDNLRRIKRIYRQRRRHAYLLSKCRKYVLLSESFRDEIKLIIGNHRTVWYENSNKIKVITNPLTISLPDRSFLDSKKKQILFVGRLVPQKGIGYLMQIWKEFSIKNYSNGWELVILGDGPERSVIESWIKRENLYNVRIESPTEKIEHYYEESSILMMTSIFEGFGLVLNEAMSRQCVPIAFSSYNAIFDIIDNGKNGILVNPFDVLEYVKQLLYLTENKDYLYKMSLEAQCSISRFDIGKIGDCWIDMFDELSKK